MYPGAVANSLQQTDNQRPSTAPTVTGRSPIEGSSTLNPQTAPAALVSIAKPTQNVSEVFRTPVNGLEKKDGKGWNIKPCPIAGMENFSNITFGTLSLVPINIYF